LAGGRRALLFLLVPAFIGGLVVITMAFTTKMPEKFSCNIKCKYRFPRMGASILLAMITCQGQTCLTFWSSLT